MTPEEFRRHFPIFETKIHLCSCSEGAASLEGMAALGRFVAGWRDHGAPWDAWMEEVESARRKFARLIGADEDEVATVPNASVGAYQVVSSLLAASPARRGIVTSDLEFPSIAHVWMAQEARGARVTHVRHERGVIPVHSWEGAIRDDTLLVSSFLVSYANGARTGLDGIARLAHERGAHLFVDAYQGAGVVPVDVHAMGIDFLVAGTLKYLLGTPGLAFLYVRRELALRLRPSLTGWFGQEDPYAFDPLHLSHAAAALRFQTGTPAIAAAFTANAGLDLILEAGVDAIWHHVSALGGTLTGLLEEAGVPLFSPTDEARGPQVTFYTEDPAGATRTLLEHGIIAAPRGQAVRLALHYYNDQEDVRRTADVVASLPRT